MFNLENVTYLLDEKRYWNLKTIYSLVASVSVRLSNNGFPRNFSVVLGKFIEGMNMLPEVEHRDVFSVIRCSGNELVLLSEKVLKDIEEFREEYEDEDDADLFFNKLVFNILQILIAEYFLDGKLSTTTTESEDI